MVDAAAAAFGGTTLRMDSSPTAQALPASPGGWINYDVEAERGLAGTALNRRQAVSALLEAGASGFGDGSVSTTGLLIDTGFGVRGVRLDSTWTRDLPDRL